MQDLSYLLKSIVESPGKLNIFVLDRQLKLVFFNGNFKKLVGKTLSLDVEVGMDFLALMAESGLQQRIKENSQRVLNGEHVTSIEDYIDGKGLLHYFESSASPITSEDGEIVGIVVFLSEVTEQIESKRLLENRESEYRRLLNSMREIIHLVDCELRITYANPALINWISKFGIGPDIVGKHLFDVFPFLPEKVHAEYQHILTTGESVFTEETTVLENAVIYTETHKIPVVENERTVGILTLIRDVTESKKVTLALADSEELFRTAFQTNPDAMGIVKLESGVFIDVNQGFSLVTGFTKKEVVGRSTIDLNLFVEPNEIQALIKEVELNGYVANMEAQFRQKHGGIYDGLVSARIFNLGGEPHLLMVIKDITDWKLVLEAIRASENFNRTVISSVGEGIVVYDRELRYKQWNKFMENLTGIKAESILGKHHKEAFPYNVTEYGIDQILERVLQGETVGSGDVRFQIRETGREGWIRCVYSPLVAAGGDVFGVVASIRDVTEARQAEEALHRSAAKYRALFEDSRDAIYLRDENNILLDVNPAMAELFGYRPEEMIGMNVNDFYPDPADGEKLDTALAEKGFVLNFEERLRRRDGEVIDCLVTISSKAADDGKGRIYQGIVRDVTEMKMLEEQFRQAQKLEAIGRLAGGVAHDFNNLLTSISGNAELAMGSLDSNHPLKSELQEILNAAKRASELTRQLLTYSRRQPLKLNPVDLNRIIARMELMLKRIIGEDVELLTITGENLWLVEGDPGQIEQVIVNLAVNAKDAMPQGGRIILETKNEIIGRDRPRRLSGLEPGNYVVLSTRDTGCGMNEETMAKIFDPFYTTKEVGKGTGLGLSTVFGIVKQSRGYIDVESKPGKGAAFNIYLPMSSESAGSVEKGEVTAEAPRGSETILVVEDEHSVLDLTRRILERQGYIVIEARSPAEALRWCQEAKAPVDLVITDIVMPGMSGVELSRELRAIWPNVKLMFMSGYTPDLVTQNSALNPKQPYLQKPFRSFELTKMVRETLDGV